MVELYVSSCAFPTRSVAEVLRLVDEAGFRHLELGSGLDPARDLLALLRARRPSIEYLIHNYFPPPVEPFVLNLASAIPENRKRSLELCRTAIDIAHAVGSGVYSVHAGFCADLRLDELGGAPVDRAPIPRDVARQNFFSSLVELRQYAGSRGVQLCVENNVIEPHNLINGSNDLALMASTTDFVDFIEQPALRDIGILLDVGHLRVSATSLGFSPSEAIEAIAHRIAMLHLSDNDGIEDQNAPFDRSAWFWPHLARLNRPLWVTIEVCGLDLPSLRALHDRTIDDLITIWA